MGDNYSQARLSLYYGIQGFDFWVFVAGWRHAIRIEWPFINIVNLLLWYQYTKSDTKYITSKRSIPDSLLRSPSSPYYAAWFKAIIQDIFLGVVSLLRYYRSYINNVAVHATLLIAKCTRCVP